MPLFEELFNKADSQIIEYNNRVIHRAFSIDAPKRVRIIVSFVKRNSEYLQGVSINMFTMKGTMTCNGITIKKGGFAIWEDHSPIDNIIDAEIKGGTLCIFNFSEKTDYRGVKYEVSLQMGSCFYYNQLGKNKYRCYCNDWEPDDDFDDLIFDIEFIDLDDPSKVIEVY